MRDTRHSAISVLDTVLTILVTPSSRSSLLLILEHSVAPTISRHLFLSLKILFILFFLVASMPLGNNFVFLISITRLGSMPRPASHQLGEVKLDGSLTRLAGMIAFLINHLLQQSFLGNILSNRGSAQGSGGINLRVHDFTRNDAPQEGDA
jgi:hypothetical protein